MQRPIGGGTALAQNIVDALEANARLSSSNYVPGIGDVPTWFVMGANQSAVTYNNISSAVDKSFFKYFPIVTFAAGSHSLPAIATILTECTLQGDTRPLAGYTWLHCADNVETIPHWTTKENAGVGAVTLSTGTDENDHIIYIECATTNPVLTSVVAGDLLFIRLAAGTSAIYTVASSSANSITLTAEAPTLGNYGDSITLIPNRSITADIVIANKDRLIFQGFYIVGSLEISGKAGFLNCAIKEETDPYVIKVTSTGDVLFYDYENTIIGSANDCILCQGGKINGAITGIGGQFYFIISSGCDLKYSRNNGGTSGFYCDCGSTIDARYCFATKNAEYGYRARRGSSMVADSSSAFLSGIGWYGQSKSTMLVTGYEEYGCTFVYGTSDATVDITA